MKVLAIVGSIRPGSYNHMALRAAMAVAPEGMTFTVARIDDIPHYDQDLPLSEAPASVVRFKEQIAEADAILMVTPEYNYSISAVLKNALEWASRPMQNNPLSGKPAAIMSASPSLLGGIRAQYHLRQICVGLNLIPMNRPEVAITSSHEKFSADGTLQDETTAKLLALFMRSFQTWGERFKA